MEGNQFCPPVCMCESEVEGDRLRGRPRMMRLTSRVCESEMEPQDDERQTRRVCESEVEGDRVRGRPRMMREL